MPRTVKLQRTEAHGLGLSIVTQDTPDGSTLHRVSEVKNDGPAQAGGVCVGDTLVSVNGVHVGGSSHEFTLTAFGLSLDGDVVLELETDSTPITSADALKPPVPLIARKSSSNLLQIRQRTSSASPQKEAPEYDIAVSSSKALSPSPKKNAQVVKYVTIQSNPSTGYIGLCLMCFADGKLRIGGVHPRGPFKNATDVELGMMVVNLNGEDIRGVPMELIVAKLTQNRGERITFGFVLCGGYYTNPLCVLAKEKGTDFTELVDEETERLVWFQQGESTTLGLNMVSTDDGTRIYEILTAAPDTPGQYTCLKEGDILLGANGMDVSTSSYAEALRAVTLERSPTILVHRCKDPVEVVPAKPVSDGMMLAEAESLHALVPSQQPNLGDTASLCGSTASGDERRGERKTVILEKDEALGLGLTLCTAGAQAGARIERLIPASPAKLSGRVKVGDHILSANGLDLTHSSHDEVCAAVSVGNKVTLVLEEDSTPLGISSSQANRRMRASKHSSPQRKSSRQSLLKRGKKSSMTSFGGLIDSTTRVVNVPITADGLGLKVITDAAKGARISEIMEGNAAASDLDVRVGDQIVTANGISLKGKTHDQVIKAMMQRAGSDKEVVLELRGDRTPLKAEISEKKVVIHREVHEGIGLKIHSAAQEKGDALGARVSEIIPGRPASRTPNIKAGDWLIEANGVRLDELNHDQIVAALQSLKGKSISLTLREDNSPMEDAENEPAKNDEGIIIGDVSMLTDIRVVQVERDMRTALLGFQFYSEASLPWVRVCDIDPHSQCASTELRSEDVIIMLNGVDYLNRGHDAIFTALRGDSPTVTLQVGRPPKNENPKMYAVKAGASMSAAPVLATFSADVTGSDISVKEINPNQFSVEKIRGGSKTAVNGVRQKDLLLRIGNQFVLDIGIHGVRKAFRQIRKTIPCVFGRHYPETLVKLHRDTSDIPWGFDIVYVPTDAGAESEMAGEYMVARLQMDSVASAQGLQHGDVIVAVNGVIAPKAAPVEGTPGLADAVNTPDMTLNVLVRRDADVPRRVITVRREPGGSFGVGFATNDGLPGAYVSKVIADGAGEKAGVKVNDVVTAINGTPVGIRSHKEVVGMVLAGPPKRLYPTMDENTLTLKLGHNAIDLEREFLQMKTAVLRRGRAGLGMKFVTKEDGVSYPRISHIEKGGVADLCGNIAYGDKIISVNGKSMSGITAQDAVEILVLSNTLNLRLVPDLADMYTVTQYIDPSIPPTLDPATLEQDWYVGDMPLPDTKMHVENAEIGGFLIRLKKTDGSAYTLFIKDESGIAKMYGIKWKPELAQYVFGERYKFESLSGLVKSLRKSGIPASNGKRLHLHDAALNYTDWFVLDSDENLPLLMQHVERSTDAHAFVVRQRQAQQGVYMLITKDAQGNAVTVAIRWYLLSSDDDIPHLFNSITAMVAALKENGVPGLNGGNVQLGAPCVADYDPAQAAAQLETTVSADDLQPVVPSSVPSSVPSVVSNTKEAADVVPPQEAAASAVPPPDAPAVSGSAASAIAAAFAAAEEAAKEAAAAVTGAASAAQSYEERKYEGLHDGESSGHTDAAAPTTADVEVGAYDEELPALPSDDSSDEEELPELAPTGDDDSEDELPELHDTAIGPGATGDDDDDDDYLPPPPTDADDELPPPPAANEIDLDGVNGSAGFAIDDTEV